VVTNTDRYAAWLAKQSDETVHATRTKNAELRAGELKPERRLALEMQAEVIEKEVTRRHEYL
jgi:hypothetical protein